MFKGTLRFILYIHSTCGVVSVLSYTSNIQEFNLNQVTTFPKAEDFPFFFFFFVLDDVEDEMLELVMMIYQHIF